MSAASETEQQAADWLARRESGAWSGDDQAALDAWVAQSTANRIALLRLETVWRKADRLRAIEPTLATADKDTQTDESEPAALPARPRRWLWPAAAAAVLAALAVPAYRQFVPASQVYSTPVGGFQQLPLADGSRVDLNTNTALDVAYTDAERRVDLTRGEAFFKVAKDHTRPFVVHAGAYRVIAVGTAFTVKLTGGEVDVAVTEGRVRVEGPATAATGRPAFVSAGQAATAPIAVASTAAVPVVRPMPPQELETALSWRDGLLTFDGKPLGEVAAEFNRYNRRQLVVDPSATGVIVDGTFRATNVDGFVRLLREGFGVQGVPAGDDEIILKRL